MGAPFTEKGSCRWKQYKFGGLVGVGYCARCIEHEAISDRELRRQSKAGVLKMEGSCGNLTNSNPAALSTDTNNSNNVGRQRKRAAPFEATATGKLNTQRCKPGTKISRRKRRKSEQLSRRAEDVFDSGKVKPGLVRKALAFVAGKEAKYCDAKARQQGKHLQSNGISNQTHWS